MKTVKQMLLTIAVLLCSVSVSAHDFEVDGIFYNILNETEKTAEVTFKGSLYNEYGNEYIGSVVIPESVTYSDVTYSVTTIGEDAFWGCSGLTSITIPNSVTTISYGAFNGCSGLTSITIPNSVTTIGNSAFYYCSGLTSITIGNSVTSIGDYAFYVCSGLASIVVEEGNSHYDSRDNCNAIIETSTNTLITGCKNTVIPNSVTTIGHNAFAGCTGLTSITIPNSVTTIGYYAFHYCSSLTSITIPNSVTTIGDDAFDGCSGLTSITIPNSVTTIGDYAFYYCTGLTSVYVESVTPATIESHTFSNIASNATLYVPIGAKATYEAAEYWSEFTNIVEYENVKSFDLTVSSVGYASMYLDYPVAIPEGVEVYTADRVEGDLLKMEETTGVIPANTGVIIRAAEGTYTFTESDETPATIETNLLKGTVTDTYIAPASNEKHYVLSVVDDVVGMYCPKLNSEGKFLNNANKAYMVLISLNIDGDDDLDTGNPGIQLSNGYRFDFSGTTAIEEVVTESTTAVPVYYDLSGRRVENPTKGIYILNGKKVLVK